MATELGLESWRRAGIAVDGNKHVIGTSELKYRWTSSVTWVPVGSAGLCSFSLPPGGRIQPFPGSFPKPSCPHGWAGRTFAPHLPQRPHRQPPECVCVPLGMGETSPRGPELWS